jgi:pilus assembly protein CpaF
MITRQTSPATALADRVRHRLATTGAPVSPSAVAAAVRAESDGVLADLQVLAALRELQQDLVGAGPLEPLLADPDTTDVLVSAPDQVWVEQGGELRRTAVRFADPESVRRLAQRLALTAGRRLDDASPFVDAALPGGIRLHAVLPPIAIGCTYISLRVLRPASHGLATLQDTGSVSAEAAALLRAIVAARLAFRRGRNRKWQDHTARRAAGLRPRRRADRVRGGSPRAVPTAPACRPVEHPAAQHRGCR